MSQALATAHAEAEFETYEAEQRRLGASAPSSSFDRLVETTEALDTREPEMPGRGKKR